MSLPSGTWGREVICPKTHSDITAHLWKRGGLGRALWVPTGSIPTSPCPQKALSPVRTQCPSRSPAPTRRPRASPQECGPGPGSGQRDSQGGDTMESRDWEGGTPQSPAPTRPQLPWLGTQPSPHSLAAGGVRGTCWGRGPRTPVPESRRAWGRSRARRRREGPG